MVRSRSFVVFGNEILVGDGRAGVLPAVERRQLDGRRRQIFVRNNGQKVTDHVKPGTLLVVGIHDVPGASLMSVWANISSLAREYSTQRLLDSRSIGLSFQRLVRSLSRPWKRRSC